MFCFDKWKSSSFIVILKNHPNYYIKFSLPVSYEMLEIGNNHHLAMNATQWNWKILKNPKMSKYKILIYHENEKKSFKKFLHRKS
jgi:hypothetical protein